MCDQPPRASYEPPFKTRVCPIALFSYRIYFFGEIFHCRLHEEVICLDVGFILETFSFHGSQLFISIYIFFT